MCTHACAHWATISSGPRGRTWPGHNRPGMSKSIRVALVNDYEIVLEWLRAFLRPYDPEITVVELDVKTRPRRPVDVTLLDTYGEENRFARTRQLAEDPTNVA